MACDADRATQSVTKVKYEVIRGNMTIEQIECSKSVTMKRKVPTASLFPDKLGN